MTATIHIGNAHLRRLLLWLLVSLGVVVGQARARAAWLWDRVDATVVATGAEREPPRARVGTVGRNDRLRWQAVVRFEYRRAGETFVGRRIDPDGTWFYSAGKARARAASYAVGQRVRAYVDPDDPARAFLEPGVTGAEWLLFGVAQFAAFVLWLARANARAEREQLPSPLAAAGD